MPYSEEYDYYGVSIRTHSDEECTETMGEILGADELEADDIPLAGSILFTGFARLMEAHAPKLFSTLPKQLDLHDTMSDMVVLMEDCSMEARDFSAAVTCEMFRNSHKNKKESDRAKALVGHLEAAQKLNGCGLAFDSETALELKMIIEKVCAIPEYIILPSYEKKPIATKPINDYLKSLNLVGKAKHREAFIRELTALLPSTKL